MQRHVMFCMTAGTVGCEMTILTSPHRGHVLVMVRALQRSVACWMAVHAPGMCEQFSYFSKDCAGTSLGILDMLKSRRRSEVIFSILRIGSAKGGHPRDRRCGKSDQNVHDLLSHLA